MAVDSPPDETSFRKSKCSSDLGSGCGSTALLLNVNALDPEQSPQVWMSALHLPIEMAEREAEWSFVLEHLDSFKSRSGQLDWKENGVPGRLVPHLASR